MKRKQFSEEQIIGILKEAETRSAVDGSESGFRAHLSHGSTAFVEDQGGGML
jgi:hypothetical protein